MIWHDDSSVELEPNVMPRDHAIEHEHAKVRRQIPTPMRNECDKECATEFLEMWELPLVRGKCWLRQRSARPGRDSRGRLSSMNVYIA
jgi:hypothetical protein